MKKIAVGLALGLVLGLSIPAAAHRDSTVSKHLYAHLHNVAHRVIAIENTVAEFESTTEYLNLGGTYWGPIDVDQVKMTLEAQGCIDQPVVWRNRGTHIGLGC